MSTAKDWFSGSTTADILSAATLEVMRPSAWQKVYKSFKSLNATLEANVVALINAGLTDHQARSIKDRPTKMEAGERLMISKKIAIITVDSPDYPMLLRQIDDPPLWLFTRGDKKVFNKSCLTVVGAGKPSAYASRVVEKLLTAELVSRLCLVSGLTCGVNDKVHQAALKHQALTIAVLAGGLDSVYPADHHHLAEEIVNAGGLLVSEYPPLSRPRPTQFHIRNRIIAGLSPLTVVIEASIRSDSLTTAASALNYGRAVWAVPSDITRGGADGANFLIKQGAKLLDDPRQLIKFYGLKVTKRASTLDELPSQLLNLLVKQALTVDQIAELTKQSIPSILGILTELELLGQVWQSQPGTYQAKKHV